MKKLSLMLKLMISKNEQKYFGCPLATKSINLRTQTDWWESYGDECLELQKFDIHVLSLICNSSRYERNWSSFEMVS